MVRFEGVDSPDVADLDAERENESIYDGSEKQPDGAAPKARRAAKHNRRAC
jgi:hypothetical protein